MELDSVLSTDFPITTTCPNTLRCLLALGPSLIDARDLTSDSCGVGFVATLKATRDAHAIVEQALTALARLAHRGATASDGKSSRWRWPDDGAFRGSCC